MSKIKYLQVHLLNILKYCKIKIIITKYNIN